MVGLGPGFMDVWFRMQLMKQSRRRRKGSKKETETNWMDGRTEGDVILFGSEVLSN